MVAMYNRGILAKNVCTDAYVDSEQRTDALISQIVPHPPAIASYSRDLPVPSHGEEMVHNKGEITKPVVEMFSLCEEYMLASPGFPDFSNQSETRRVNLIHLPNCTNLTTINKTKAMFHKRFFCI